MTERRFLAYAVRDGRVTATHYPLTYPDAIERADWFATFGAIGRVRGHLCSAREADLTSPLVYESGPVQTFACGHAGLPDNGTSCPDLAETFCGPSCHRDAHADAGSRCSTTDPRYDTERMEA